MNNFFKTQKLYHEFLREQYKIENISSLLQEKFNNENHLIFFSNNTNKVRNLYSTNNTNMLDINYCEYSYNNSYFDSWIMEMEVISQDIQYCLGNIFLFKGYITNSDSSLTLKHTDRRYFFYINTLLEKLYNYCDKIARILWRCFIWDRQKDFNDEYIYFDRVFKRMPDIYKQYDEYKWLEDFRHKEYKEINDKRDPIVHRESLQSNFVNQYSKMDNDSKLDLNYYRIFELPDTLKNYMKLTFKVFESSISLIGKI